MRYNLNFLLLFLAQILFAQSSIEDVVKKMQERFTGTNISIEMSYNTYPTYTSKELFMSYKAYLMKNNSNTYFKLHNTEFVNIGKNLIKIAHDQKMVQFNEVDKSDFQKINPISIENLLPHFVKSELNIVGNEYHCTFYTSDITQLPYSRIKLIIDSSSYDLKKQIMYLNQAKKYKDKVGEIKTNYPRLEIIIQKKDSKASDKKIFVLSNYVSIKENKPVLSSQYKEYQLVN